MKRRQLTVLALVLLALALRLWNLQFQSLWWDEGVSIYLSGAGLQALTIGKDFSVDLHPPGYHVLLALWRLIIGPSVFSMRLLSVFFGTLTIPLTYTFTRLLSSHAPRAATAAWLAALLAVVSPIDVYYSQETRMYALLPVIGLITLIATIRVARRGRARDWVVWVVVNAVGLYVYYYLGLLTVAEAAYLLGIAKLSSTSGRPDGPQTSWSGGGFLRSWAIAVGTIVLGYVPWLIVLTRGLRSTALALPSQTEVHLTIPSFLYENVQDLTIGFDTPPGTVALLVLSAAIAVYGAVILGRRAPESLSLLLGCGAIALIGAGAVLVARPFFYPRFILFLLGPLWAVLGYGLAALPRPRILASLVVLPLLLANGWTLDREHTTARAGVPDDYRVVFQSLAAIARSGDVVLCGYPWQAGYVQAYLGPVGPRAAFIPRPVDAAQVNHIVGTAGRAWVYSYDPDRHFVDGPFERVLGAQAPTQFVDQYGDSRVRLFGSSVVSGLTSAQPLATFGSAIDLVDAGLSGPGIVRPGDVVSTVLRWQARAVPPLDYTVFVHLLGSDGKLHGQLDAPPLGGAFPTSGWTPGAILVDRYAFAVNPGAPPGRYQIEVGLYRSDTGDRLTVGPKPQSDNLVVIGTVTIE